MVELPPLSQIASLCDVIAQVMNRTANLDYRDPFVDISTYDAEYGEGVMEDPLRTAHKMTRMYLTACGDFVYSIGKLLNVAEPMVVSPAVLARSAAEHASRCKYISDPDDEPEIRLSKMFNLLREGFNDFGVNKPGANPALIEHSKLLNDWRNKMQLPKTKLPNYAALVLELSPDMGRAEYERLSAIAHGSAVTLTEVFLSAQMGHKKRIEDAWRNGLFAVQCGLLAAANVCILRDGDKTEINHCLALLDEAVLSYNRYLWDLSMESGFNPGVPRP
ncbi:hypothetical protein [Rhodococcus rhodochrous]|uniref:hypothetical protein n=1 Tax=Rhodococcus rhodochrous TaxID=1829 RepID=UPI0023F6EF8C